MSGSLKLGIMLIVGVLALSLIVSIAGRLISLILPLAIVAGVGLILYSLINRKALGGGRRRYLP